MRQALELRSDGRKSVLVLRNRLGPLWCRRWWRRRRRGRWSCKMWVMESLVRGWRFSDVEHMRWTVRRLVS